MLVKLKQFFPFLLILTLGLFMVRNLFNPGFPDSHDGHNHLARLANFKLMIEAGQIPPRIAPNLDYRFGYPVFNFSYYLSYFIAWLFTFFLSFEISLKIAMIFFYILGGGGVYLWLSQYIKKNSSILAAILYLSAPYQFVNLFIRGNTGAVAAIGLLPLCFYALDQASQNFKKNFPPTSIIIAIYWLSHNLTTFTGLPVLVIYFFFLSLKQKPKNIFISLKKLIILFGISFSLGAFFYLPALVEKKYTVMPQTNSGIIYTDHFVYLKQLISGNWPEFGYSVVGSDDTMSFSLGNWHFIIFILSFSIIIFKGFVKKTKKIHKFLFCFLGSFFVFSIFMMLSPSVILYRTIPMIHYIQFPWRWLSIAILMFAGLVSYGIDQINSKKVGLTLVIFASVLLVYQSVDKAQASKYIHYSDQEYIDFSFTSTSLDENKSIWFDRDKNIDLPTMKVFEQNHYVQPEIIVWKAGKHVYRMNYDQPMRVFERTAYFPGWQVLVNNQKIKINYQSTEYPGIISFDLPAGNYLITSKFTQQTPVRIIGNTLSLTAFIGLLAYLISDKINKVKREISV